MQEIQEVVVRGSQIMMSKQSNTGRIWTETSLHFNGLSLVKNLVSALSQDKKGITLTVMRRKLVLHTGTNSFTHHPLTGEKMVEYHVDTHDSFQEKMQMKHG
jgi:hypothetical protein